MPTFREVTADWSTLVGDPSVGQTIRYELNRSSFTTTTVIDYGKKEDVVAPDGTTETILWTNLEGLVPTRYTVTFPKGDQYTFLLPPGDDPVSLTSLLANDAIEWQPPTLAEALQLVYDELANTTDPELGDALIGTRLEADGAVGRTMHDKLEEIATLGDFGVVGDLRELTGLSITAASATLTAASASFTVDDVGKYVSIAGAGQPRNAPVIVVPGALGPLSTTIAAFVSATEVTLTLAAGSTVADASGYVGTDDSAQFATAIAWAAERHGILRSDASRHHLIAATVTVTSGVAGLEFEGARVTIHGSVGNAPGFLVEGGSPITISDGLVTGDMTEIGYDAVNAKLGGNGLFDDSVISTQLRRAFKVMGSGVTFAGMEIVDAVVAFDFWTDGDGAGTIETQASDCIVQNCTLRNTVVRYALPDPTAWSGQCVGIYFRGAKNITVQNVTIDGFGQSISGGSANLGSTTDPVYLYPTGLTLQDITIIEPGDNGIYLEAEHTTISNIRANGYKQSAVKFQGSHSTITLVNAQPTAGSGGVTIFPRKTPQIVASTTMGANAAAGDTSITLATGGASAAGIVRGSWLMVYQTTKAPVLTQVYDLAGDVLSLSKPLTDATTTGRPVKLLSEWAGENVTVSECVISGVVNNGISVYGLNFGMPLYLKNPSIIDNRISFSGGNARYGIYFTNSSKSDGAIISRNGATGHIRGLFMNAVTSSTLAATIMEEYAAGVLAVTVDSSNGFADDDPIEIDQADGTVHTTRIATGGITPTGITFTTPTTQAIEKGAGLRRVGAATFLTSDYIGSPSASLSVADTTDFQVGDTVIVDLSAGGTDSEVIDAKTSTTLTLHAPLSGAASLGARVIVSGARPTSQVLTALASLGATSVTVAAAQAFRPGDIIEVELDTTARFQTVVQPPGASPTTVIQIKPALPSAAASGNSVTLLNASHRAATISGNDFRDATAYGVHLVNAYRCLVVENQAQHSATTGYQLDNVRNCRFDLNQAGVTNASKTQAIAFRMTGISDRCTYLFNQTLGATTAYSGLTSNSAVAAAGNGQFVFGTQTPTTGTGLDFARTLSNPSSGQNGIQSAVNLTFAADSAFTNRGIVGDLVLSVGSGANLSASPAGQRGVAGNVRSIGAGNVTFMAGVVGQTFQTGAGTTANAAAIAALAPSISAGAITVQSGVYIAAQSGAAGVATGYAINAVGTNDPSYFAGRIGVGVTNPTGRMHLAAVTPTANTAPLKLTNASAGQELTTAESGVFEYAGGSLSFTQSDATRRFVMQAANATKTTAGAPYTNDGYITVRIGGTNVRLMTTA